LIFCYFFIKENGEALLSTLAKIENYEKLIALRGNERANADSSTGFSASLGMAVKYESLVGVTFFSLKRK